MSPSDLAWIGTVISTGVFSMVSENVAVYGVGRNGRPNGTSGSRSGASAGPGSRRSSLTRPAAGVFPPVNLLMISAESLAAKAGPIQAPVAAKAAAPAGHAGVLLHDLQRASTNPIPEFFDYVLLRTGYRRMLQESRDLQDESRLENLEELLNSAREYYEQNPQASLADYLDSLTLISDLDRYEQGKGVTLMTLHAAKGLEFAVVFLAVFFLRDV